MRSVPFLALVAAAAVAPILSAGAQQPSTTLLIQPPTAESCPVGFSARHAIQGATVMVNRGQKHPEQAYRITFDPRGPRSIVEARITLHGMAGHHVIPARTKARADAAESFTLSPSADGNHLYQSIVHLNRLTGVQSVELNELTYADGTHWHESPDGACRIAPDPFMLVAAGH